MPWQKLPQFLQLAKGANNGKEPKSLAPLIAVLRASNNPPQASVIAEFSHIDDTKRQKYQSALNLVLNQYGLSTATVRPRGGVPVVPGAPVVTAQQLNVALNNARAHHHVTAAQLARAQPAAAPANAIPVQDAMGWSLVPDPTNPPPLLTVPHPPPFTHPEIRRINEAVRRTIAAVDWAIREIISVRVSTTPPLPNSPGERYWQLFGPCDTPQADRRRQTVLSNFNTLRTKLDAPRGGVLMGICCIDARYYLGEEKTFAWTHRGSAVHQPYINVWIGPLFFRKGVRGQQDFQTAGAVSSDATVCTLVHEFAHAVFNASDVPQVGSGGTLDANGMPTTPGDVANDLNSDIALAQATPDLAVLNADNYGQFALLALRANERG
ncbi:MAG TPA: hypothetical protein VEK34_16340 [Methylocella sp.]|nr:hypothetical protein [Methylocella sp.]